MILEPLNVDLLPLPTPHPFKKHEKNHSESIQILYWLLSVNLIENKHTGLVRDVGLTISLIYQMMRNNSILKNESVCKQT